LLDEHGRVVAAATTDDAGRYEFVALPPGLYAVRERQPDGMFDGLEWVGSGGGLVHLDADLITGIALTSGAALSGYDFAEHAPTAAADALTEALARRSAWIAEPAVAARLQEILPTPAAQQSLEGPPGKREPAAPPAPRVEPMIAAVNHDVEAIAGDESAAALESLEADRLENSAFGEATPVAAPPVRLVELPLRRPVDAAARDEALEQRDAERADDAFDEPLPEADAEPPVPADETKRPTRQAAA
jgi:hypothetical protein